MKLIKKILVLSIFSVVLQIEDADSNSNRIGASTNTTSEISAQPCGCPYGILKNPDGKSSTSELSHGRQRRLGKYHHHKWRNPHLYHRNRREVPLEHHQYGSLTAGDPGPQIIPTEWILKYCFKQTPLEHYMKNRMEMCEPNGKDFSCMFSLETEKDSLESRLDRLDDYELRLPLKRAVADCRERHERQSASQEETQVSDQFSEDQLGQTDDSKATIETVNFVDPVLLNKVLEDLDRDAFNLTVATPTPQEQEYKPKKRIRRVYPQRSHRFYRRSSRRASPIDDEDRKFLQAEREPAGQNAVKLKDKRIGGCDHSNLLYPQNKNGDQERPLVKVSRNTAENEEEIGVGKPIEIMITLDKNARESLDRYNMDSKVQEDDVELPEDGTGLNNDVEGRSGVKEHIGFTGKGSDDSERSEHTEISMCIAEEAIKVCKPKLLKALSVMLN